MVDLDKLVEWLGPEGASAGLQASRLSVKELVAMARLRKLPLSAKPTRREIANELAYAQVKKIDKRLEDLLAMSQDALFDYFKTVQPTAREILEVLTELGVKPNSTDKKQLLRFAAREISDTGLYQRVARGSSGSAVKLR